jgi:hypothetical protein
VWSRIRPRYASLLGKSIAVAFSNSRSPREYEFATDTSDRHPFHAGSGLSDKAYCFQ